MDIGKKIKEFRQNKGYSLQELSNLVNVSKSAVQQYENNTTKPSNAVLKSIAAALGIGVWDFYSSNENELSIESLKFRDGHKLKDLDNERNNIKLKALESIRNYLEMETILDEKIDFKSPIEDKINTYNDVEKAVKKIRKKWKHGTSPIDSVVDFLENVGIKIIGVDRNTDSPASCGWVKTYPIIIINENQEHNWEITRRRFSLMHEAGHIFFNNLVDENIEEAFCNRFAAAILLPDEALISIIGKNRTSISLGELKRVKETYGVSIQTIIYRMSHLKLISEESKKLMLKEYDNWRVENKNFGSYKKSDELPKRFYDLLRRALTENRIERYKASEISNIKIDELKDKLMVNDKIDLI